MDDQGNLERTWKIREKIREFEKKMAVASRLQKIYLSVQEESGVLSREIV